MAFYFSFWLFSSLAFVRVCSNQNKAKSKSDQTENTEIWITPL